MTLSRPQLPTCLPLVSAVPRGSSPPPKGPSVMSYVFSNLLGLGVTLCLVLLIAL